MLNIDLGDRLDCTLCADAGRTHASAAPPSTRNARCLMLLPWLGMRHRNGLDEHSGRGLKHLRYRKELWPMSGSVPPKPVLTFVASQSARLPRSSANAALPALVASDIVSKKSDCRTALALPAV